MSREIEEKIRACEKVCFRCDEEIVSLREAQRNLQKQEMFNRRLRQATWITAMAGALFAGWKPNYGLLGVGTTIASLSVNSHLSPDLPNYLQHQTQFLRERYENLIGRSGQFAELRKKKNLATEVAVLENELSLLNTFAQDLRLELS